MAGRLLVGAGPRSEGDGNSHGFAASSTSPVELRTYRSGGRFPVIRSVLPPRPCGAALIAAASAVGYGGDTRRAERATGDDRR